MILLEKKDYYKTIEPLKLVTINNLFARVVAEQKAPGEIYVDNINNPETFYVLHSYGMSLLFGKWDNLEFNQQFKEYVLNNNQKRNKYKWMQVFPDEWNSTLSILLGNYLVKQTENIKNSGLVELSTRVNFKFSLEKYLKRVKKENKNVEIIKTDECIYNNMPGSVIPKYYWYNEKDFIKNSIGFSLFFNKQLAATAFSSWIIDKKLEIGIETIAEFRGKGFAEMVCEAIIEYCIENEYEPIWSCRLENVGSCKLAKKLGFEPVMENPYYILYK